MAEDLKQDWKSIRLEHWLVEAWTRALSELMATLELAEEDAEKDAAPRWKPIEPDAASWAAWPSPTWYEITLDLAPGAALRIGLDAAVERDIAERLFGDDAGGQGTEQTSQAFQEVLRQAGDSFAEAVGERLGRQLAASDFQTADAPTDADWGVDITRPDGDASERMALWFSPPLVGPALADETAPAAADVSSGAAPPRLAPSETGRDAPELTSADELASDRKALANLKLLLDVELDLSVSFGHTELPLEEVLKLASGSIVELDRSANDPVAILVNGSVVAYGDVVVVDGNYGIRITEISSKQQRIESIF